MEIHINTTENSEDVVELRNKKEVIEVAKSKSQKTNQLLQQLHTIKENTSFTWDSIEEITVNTGPGVRFTRTRLGVAVVNAMGFALNKPVNGKVFETPQYYKEPNITYPTS